jgi:predicted RNA-binding Zn ribbon-like protein
MRDLLEFTWVGGHAALDFSNTCEWYQGEVDIEWLGDYARLVDWLRLGDLLDLSTAHDLKMRAEKHPAEAAEVYANTVALRETILAICTDCERDAAALATINRFASQARAKQRIFWDGEAFVWMYPTEDLRMPLWLMAEAVAELVTRADFARVHQCAADDCTWLFLDVSRTGKRRWCDMATCGNRAKARRHYHRKNI